MVVTRTGDAGQSRQFKKRWRGERLPLELSKDEWVHPKGGDDGGGWLVWNCEVEGS